MPKFKHRRLPVEAVQYTGKNADELVALGGGKWVKVFPHPPNPREAVYLEDEFYKQDSIFEGSWLVKEKDGRLVVYDDDAFQASFSPRRDKKGK